MQGWSPDSTCALWFRVFGVIGPVNKIKQPISHKFALQSVNHIVQLLHAVRFCFKIDYALLDKKFTVSTSSPIKNY